MSFGYRTEDDVDELSEPPHYNILEMNDDDIYIRFPKQRNLQKEHKIKSKKLSSTRSIKLKIGDKVQPLCFLSPILNFYF